MIEIKPTQDDIDNIAKKLDEFSAVLNERESTLLLCLFGVAAKSIADAGRSTNGNARLPGLATTFRQAFTAGLGNKFAIDNLGEGEGIFVQVVMQKANAK